jgi:hypothetical protein
MRCEVVTPVLIMVSLAGYDIWSIVTHVSEEAAASIFRVIQEE